MFPIALGFEKVSKTSPYSDQIGRQIDQQIMFLGQPFWERHSRFL
jgi:hypothetical protein